MHLGSRLSGVHAGVPSKVKTMSIRFPESIRLSLERLAVGPYTKHSLIVAAVAQSLELWAERPSELLGAYEAVKRLRGGLDESESLPEASGPIEEPAPMPSEPVELELPEPVLSPVSPPVSFEEDVPFSPGGSPEDAFLPLPVVDTSPPKGPPSNLAALRAKLDGVMRGEVVDESLVVDVSSSSGAVSSSLGVVVETTPSLDVGGAGGGGGDLSAEDLADLFSDI